MGRHVTCVCGNKVYISDRDNRGACEKCRRIINGVATAQITKTTNKGGKTNITKPIQKEDITNEIRIKLFKKEGGDIKLKNAFERLKAEYPQVSLPGETFDSFIQKIFPNKLQQDCVIKNQSFKNEEKGHVVRRVAIYNSNSSYLKKRLPEGKYVVFYGRPKDGEFIIDDIKLIENPKRKPDDHAGKYSFLYDGPKHSNALWDITEEAAQNVELIGYEIAQWNDYLDWKKQISEMRIKGIKYISVKVDLNEKQISFLTVAPSKEEFEEFKVALFRNEMSVFSNDYSTDRWKFSFNKEIQNTQNFDNGVAVQFIDFGEQYLLRNVEYIKGWEEHREYCKKDKKENSKLNIEFYISEMKQQFPNAFLSELKFELSSNGSTIIERQLKRKGFLSQEDAQEVISEFYGEGYIAASQIGDFALISRLKGAVNELANGHSVSQNLDEWLFDITKARTNKKIVNIEKWQNNDINTEQKEAVKKILSAPDVCLIQGPPGTGKTTVIAEAIYQLVIRGKRVLVTSQANLAVDNALERLISNPNVRAIRLGDKRKIASSVDNITEKNVLESFYNSILDYIGLEYIDGWKKEDAEKWKYDEEKRQIISLKDNISNIKKEIKNNRIDIDKKKNQIDEISQKSELIWEATNQHNAEKANLQLMKMYCEEKVDDISFSISKESIEKIWGDVFLYLEELKKHSLYLSKAIIDTNKLNLPSRVKQANSIFANILQNIRIVSKMSQKINSGIELGPSQELENLKAQEIILKEEMLKNASAEIIAEWQTISKQIKQFNSQGIGLSDEELGIFNIENDEVNLLQIQKVIDNTSDIVDQLKQSIIRKINNIINSYQEEQEDFEKKLIILEEEVEALTVKEAKLNQILANEEKDFKNIFEKYKSDEEDVFRAIEEAKERVSIGNKSISRQVWEPIFEDLEKWINEIPDYAQENDMYLDNYINGCNVVGVSCTENIRTLTDKGFDDFDVVIIDEVSKATPPELLIPLIKGRKAVLVGDHRQLPPLFNEHEKSYYELVENQEEVESGEFSLTVEDFEKYKIMVTASVFQKYFENSPIDLKQSLLVQYRMHSDIMDIVNMFYDGKLRDGAKNPNAPNHKAHNLTIDSIIGTEMIIPQRHAYWFDSSSLRGETILEQRKRGSTSTENILESYMILEILKRMELQYANMDLKNKVTIGVISFYYDQVKMIRKLIKNESFYYIDVEINTVDRFQGKEKEIIIVSLVRNIKTKQKSLQSYVAAYQRINVGFSRAQNLLLIVGATNMYADQPVLLTDMDNGEEKETFVYKDIIEMLEMKGTYFTSDDIINDLVADEIFNRLRGQEVPYR